MRKFLSIAQNTFVDILRQPIYGVIVASSLAIMIISPQFTLYTMSDDNKLLREVGLSTLLLMSLFIAIFSASGVISEEISSKTILTVLSKPVRRPVVILAKFFGVAAAVSVAHYLCTIVFLMAVRNGVPQTVNDLTDPTVLYSAIFIACFTLILAVFFNYVYDWKFSSTAIGLMTISSTIVLIFLLFIDRKWTYNPANNQIALFDVYGSLLLLLAAMVVTSLAVMFSSRFNIVVTLLGCVGIFLLGLVSDYIFGQLPPGIFANIGRSLTPNLQVFWISDAIYENSQIPLRYIGIAFLYAGCYVGAVLFATIAIFQKREIGK